MEKIADTARTAIERYVVKHVANARIDGMGGWIVLRFRREEVAETETTPRQIDLIPEIHRVTAFDEPPVGSAEQWVYPIPLPESC